MFSYLCLSFFSSKESQVINYQVAGDRCAVVLKYLKLPVRDGEALEILAELGFQRQSVSLPDLARSCIGVTSFKSGARLSEAPAQVDCSSFICWLYSQLGIALPRRVIQLSECGRKVEPSNLRPGDLVFFRGLDRQYDYYRRDPARGIAHVGMVSNTMHTMIHAAGLADPPGVMEAKLGHLADLPRFQGAVRILPTSEQLVTLKIPPDREVYSSDDLRWLILERLGYRGY